MDTKQFHYSILKPSPNASTMQTSALYNLLADSNSSTESLDYFNASLPKIKIDPVEHVQPIDLQPLRLDNNDISIEYLPTSPSPTPTLVDETSAPLPTREEKHRTAHTTREVEAKDKAANTATKKYHTSTADNFCTTFNEMAAPSAYTALPTTAQAHANLQHIYCILHPLNNNSSDNDSCSSRWDSNDNEEYAALWPLPLTTPIKGDNIHPLQLTVCRPHPG